MTDMIDADRPRKPLHIALQVSGGCALLACGYFFWRRGLSAFDAVLLGLCSVFLLRFMVRANMVPGFSGQNADSFKLRPVIIDVAKAAACLLGGFSWVAIGSIAVRFKEIPDSPAGVALILIPGVGLLGWGAFFLIRAQSRAAFGRKPKV
jgi:hypothetical protein